MGVDFFWTTVSALISFSSPELVFAEWLVVSLIALFTSVTAPLTGLEGGDTESDSGFRIDISRSSLPAAAVFLRSVEQYTYPFLVLNLKRNTF
jgi:hypothetical protein